MEMTAPRQYGVCVTNYGDVASAEAIIGTAKLAEEVGFDSVWVSDHVVVPPTFGNIYGRSFMDPFICLTYAAAETQRVKLGTTVVVVPLRNPLVQAKMLSTLDVLSGGRVIFGVGIGWDQEEFEALGVPFHERGERTDEYLEIMKTLWTVDPPGFQGRYYSFSDIAFEPKPLQSPHIPIWVGGNGGPAFRRAVRTGAAWHPGDLPPGELASKYENMRRFALRQGAPVPALTHRMYLRPKDINPQPMATPQTAFEGDREELVAHIAQYAGLPIEHTVFEFVVSNAADLKESIRYLAQEVLPDLRERSPG
jgi:probable F420-dependent oxidoreductase